MTRGVAYILLHVCNGRYLTQEAKLSAQDSEKSVPQGDATIIAVSSRGSTPHQTPIENRSTGTSLLADGINHDSRKPIQSRGAARWAYIEDESLVSPTTLAATTALKENPTPREAQETTSASEAEQHRAHHTAQDPSASTHSVKGTLQTSPVPIVESNAQVGEDRGALTNTVNELIALGSGTGAQLGQSKQLDRELVQRMQTQDVAALCMLLVVYYGALLVGFMMVYRVAHSNLRARYHAYDSAHVMSLTSDSEEYFVQTFASPPAQVLLRVSGYRRSPADNDSNGENVQRTEVVDDAFLAANGPFGAYHGFARRWLRYGAQWRGEVYKPDFSFALDLHAWVSLDNIEGRDEVREFMRSDALRKLSITKETHWDQWEELAVNIKKRMRSMGYTGVTVCDFISDDTLHVYRNEPWSNIFYNAVTRSLCVLSIIGTFIFFPYMHFKSKTMRMKCNYRVQVDISEFWQLMESRLSPSMGFNQ